MIRIGCLRCLYLSYEQITVVAPIWVRSFPPQAFSDCFSFHIQMCHQVWHLPSQTILVIIQRMRVVSIVSSTFARSKSNCVFLSFFFWGHRTCSAESVHRWGTSLWMWACCLLELQINYMNVFHSCSVLPCVLYAHRLYCVIILKWLLGMSCSLNAIIYKAINNAYMIFLFLQNRILNFFWLSF